MKRVNVLLCIFILLPASAFALRWADFWQTRDQQAVRLLQAGKASEALPLFKNKAWRNIALYRSGDYNQAFNLFSKMKTSDAQYNAGNSAAFSGQYQKAVKAYDQAIALNPNNVDAIYNRDIIKKLMSKKNQQQDKSESSNSDKKENENSSSSQQKKTQTSSSQKDTANKQSADNKTQKNKNDLSEQQQSDNPMQKQSNDNKQSSQAPKNDKKQNDIQQSQADARPKNDDKNQTLRRLTDDPGGLLQQKFLRDYIRRHDVVENSD